ncbi:GNAT family N-acetyltransferase [Methylobacterium sp. J-026]|uniref:GNAT family N-acetyltransferase n=1 Tax=Methylobacterium sp. J-026 TaxID=2836624 RepID=UPI001FB8A122|nr:GNAT family N-acetyltransferase [Methylobacterium sp. J-026]MCJ2135216.1 GNAT family N-acetyltransferase [Methylobacterium sp. J-026]
MADIIYRAARATDALTIAAIHVASWRDAYRSLLDPVFLAGPIEDDRRSHWLGKFDTPSANFLVDVAATADGNLVGFAATHRDRDPRWGSLLDNLHVLPEMRGRKIGEALLRSAARALASRQADDGLHLWVFEANAAALRFYTRLGGHVVERKLSQAPIENDRMILRVHWPALSDLL